MFRQLFFLAGLIVLSANAGAGARGIDRMAPPFTLPDLPYAADALAPVIDAETMRVHHDRHHQAYVTALNEQIARRPDLAGADLASILGQVSRLEPAVRNNAGGHYNHSLFWTMMAPPGQGGRPAAALQARIERDFGSFDAFVATFEASAKGVFGSGWAWLVLKPDGTLAVTSTANQDNPLMDVAPVRGIPLLALDVWEHAYYLAYQNRRPDYISTWWKVVNWKEVSRRYAEASALRD